MCVCVIDGERGIRQIVVKKEHPVPITVDSGSSDSVTVLKTVCYRRTSDQEF